MMTKVLTFRVGIEGLEDKIWREIEIHDERTMADLAYTILATFDSLAYHLYNIKYKNYEFDCSACPIDDLDCDKHYNAVTLRLCSLGLVVNDKLEMEYDYGATTTFKITLIDEREMGYYEGYLYPRIVAGAGHGMLDDISDFELKEIVDDIDEKGYSEHYFTPGYPTNKKYDYRKFNLKENNSKLKGLVLEIKNGFEVE